MRATHANKDIYKLISWRILKERLWLLIVIHSIFSSAMIDFRDNDVLLPTGYDII